MASQKLIDLLDKIFDVGILVKAIFGFFEILSGIFLVFSGGKIINSFITYITQSEISDDPHDFFANILIKSGNNLAAGSHIFAIVYLIVHGIINLLLVVAVAKGNKKIYPFAILVFGIFIVYQSYRYFYSFSPVLLLLIVFDIFFVYVIYLEYRKNIN